MHYLFNLRDISKVKIESKNGNRHEIIGGNRIKVEIANIKISIDPNGGDRFSKVCCAAIRTISIRGRPFCDCGFTRVSEFSAIGLLTRSKRSRSINLIWPRAREEKNAEQFLSGTESGS